MPLPLKRETFKQGMRCWNFATTVGVVLLHNKSLPSGTRPEVLPLKGRVVGVFRKIGCYIKWWNFATTVG
jgi:hypothetical protein